MIALAARGAKIARPRCGEGRRRSPSRTSVSKRRAFGVDVSQFEGMMDAETSYAGVTAVKLTAFKRVMSGVVYGGLGLLATSFAVTFFVAPAFHTSLKEPEEWKDIYPQLVQKSTPSITPLQAAAKLSNPQSHHHE